MKRVIFHEDMLCVYLMFDVGVDDQDGDRSGGKSEAFCC